MSAEQMPERYRPGPKSSTVSESGPNTGRPQAKIPRIVLRDWLGLAPGARLAYAPRQADSVKVGTTVPNMIGENTVSPDPSPTTTQPAAYLPTAVLVYIGASIGDTLTFHRHAEGVVEIRCGGDE